MLTRDYVENELIKKLTLANGTVFEGQELKDVLNALVAGYSWSDDPDTTTAGKDIDARLRAKLNNKPSLLLAQLPTIHAYMLDQVHLGKSL